MENEKQIAVYFINGKRAIFKMSELLIYPNTALQSVSDLRELNGHLRNDTTIINWDNVCFLRAFKEEEDDA